VDESFVSVNSKNQGVTLLEAIVALVLIATTGIALLDWVNNNLMNLNRIQAIQQRNEATRSALAFVELLNPLETPEGNQTLGIYTFQWQSQLVEPAKDGVSFTGDLGFYQLGLYAVQFTISINNQVITQFTVRQVGYKQIRKPSLDF
jgi:general secretion pathway protein I